MSDSISQNPSDRHELSGPNNDLSSLKCSLCGLPVVSSKSAKSLNDKIFHFCCQGCLAVFEILFNRPEGIPSNFRETDLYRACVESGVIPRNEDEEAFSETEPEVGGSTTSLPPYEEKSDHVESLTLIVKGMWCTACSWLIEEVMTKTHGIVEAKVLFLSDIVRVKYLPHLLTPQEIANQISRLGYRPSFLEDDSVSSEEKRDLLIRLGISSVLSANTMMISFALYTGFFEELSQGTIQYLSYPLWILSSGVLFYGGLPILRRSWMGLRSRQATMDALIVLGSFSAYGYSIIQLFRGSLHLYFDTASMLITFVLIGRYIESQARDKVSRGISELYQMANQKVRLWSTERERWVSSEAVHPGEEFLVLPGERIPLDGRIVSGRSNVDESILTGEPRPKKKGAHDGVLAGTLLLEGELRIRAEGIGRKSSLGQMIDLMQEALEKKNPFERWSDRIMRWFVPVISLLAAGSALYLLSSGVSWEAALLRAITVLVITCPCALGIASPLAKVAAIGKARSKGILFRNPEAFEKMKVLDAIVFDKTGTLTEGRYSLQKIVAPDIPEKEVLRRLASVEIHSDHYLAREIVRAARGSDIEIDGAKVFESFDGLGVKGVVEGRNYFLGNRRFLENREIPLPEEFDQGVQPFETKGMTTVFLGWNEKVQGFLVFGDALKERAVEVIHDLQKRGIELWLVSGDAPETTRAIAEELGIERYQGHAFPKDKVELIKTLQGKGRRVGMVGDGLNDAASLAQADVGISLGASGNLTQEASDITLLSTSPSKVLETLDLSSRTMKIIRQNLFFAFFYNGLAIPLAVTGALTPLIAVTAMFASSLTVIWNTLRILKDR